MTDIKRIVPGPRMSQAVAYGNLVFLAGQVAQRAAGASVTEQTKDILARIDEQYSGSIHLSADDMQSLGLEGEESILAYAPIHMERGPSWTTLAISSLASLSQHEERLIWRVSLMGISIVSQPIHLTRVRPLTGAVLDVGLGTDVAGGARVGVVRRAGRGVGGAGERVVPAPPVALVGPAGYQRMHRRGQAELETLLRERELMFSLSEVGIVYQRGARIERANQAMAELTGYSAPELTALDPAELYASARGHDAGEGPVHYFSSTPDVGDLVMLFRETKFTIRPSDLDPSSLALFREPFGEQRVIAELRDKGVPSQNEVGARLDFRHGRR